MRLVPGCKFKAGGENPVCTNMNDLLLCFEKYNFMPVDIFRFIQKILFTATTDKYRHINHTF